MVVKNRIITSFTLSLPSPVGTFLCRLVTTRTSTWTLTCAHQTEDGYKNCGSGLTQDTISSGSSMPSVSFSFSESCRTCYGVPCSRFRYTPLSDGDVTVSPSSRSSSFRSMTCPSRRDEEEDPNP